jgi:sugar lactone lactonase YvrE
MTAAKWYSVLSVLVFAGLCAAGNAGNRPLPDVVIDDTYVFPESMSAAKDGTLFIGSLKGIIFRAAPGESKARPWIKPSEHNGLLAVFGVLVDDRSGALWICSSPFSLRDPPAVGTAALMAFDLKTGAQRGVYPFPEPASLCNDITIARDGTAFASDTPNGRILKLPRGGKTLEVFAQDERLKGIDGLAFSGDGTLYVNIVTRGELLRVERTSAGKAGEITMLTPSAPLASPDGFRLVRGKTFLLAEGPAGRIDEVTIDGDHAEFKVLREGLVSAPAVTLVGRTAYALEGKLGYLFNPKLRGQDPGVFTAYAVPLTQEPHRR